MRIDSSYFVLNTIEALIQTQNCTVNELQLEDALDLHVLMVSNTSRFERFFPKTLEQNLSVDASEKYIHLKQEENRINSELTYAIREQAGSKPIGLIILKQIDWDKRVGELAYCLGKDYEGRGLMTQTVRALSKYAFETLGLETLQIISHHTNKGSIRVAEKCGFAWQRKLLNEHTPPGESPLDMELYELFRV